jgi:hypothetical protein
LIGTPSEEHPLLVGLLVDVSASMTSSIRNATGPSQNRLQSFQTAFGDLATRARDISGEAGGERVRLFAYGFGFGNPLGMLFGGASSAPVVDLLQRRGATSSTVGIKQLAAEWAEYKAHVEGMAIKMFGATPMLQGVKAAAKRIREEQAALSPCGTILFILSDGDPTDSSPNEVSRAVGELISEDTLVVSCYVTDHDITTPRTLYGVPQETWPSGARLMFDVASKVPLGSAFYHYLREHHWELDGDARFFSQVNQSEVLREFLQVVISPLAEKDAGRPAEVFLSYSHTDSRWRDRLKVHLKPLVRDDSIDIWDDTRIKAGQAWKAEIEAALERARVAILLVSADFLASDFVQDEELPTLLEAAERAGVSILPIVVGPSRFAESPVGRFQAANSPNRPLSGLRREEAESVLVEISRRVEEIVG